MLSIGRVAPGGSDYYLASVTRSAEGYYLGPGEAPGTWTGSAVHTLGLAGEVDPDAFCRVLDGCHPDTGDRLVPGGERRVGGFDLTFSAPKSVSLLWALHPDPHTRAVVTGAHRAAIGDGLAYLESDALWARRGAGGRHRMPVTGLVAAAFDHRSSRTGDPQLHTHVVVANMVADRSGRWSAPDGRAVYRHARTAGFVYQARLRHELSTRLGVTWGPVRSGQADLAGIGRDVIDRYSTRRGQVTQALAAQGLSSSTAARVATLDTRPAKPDHSAAIGLHEQWAQSAEEAGLDVTGLVGQPRTLPVLAVETDELVAELVGAGGLTAHASTFDRRAVITALAGEHRDGATLAGLVDLAGRVVSSPQVVDLGAGQPEGAERRWTTVDLLALEADLEARATRPWPDGARVGVADDVAVGRALYDRPQLSSDQAGVVVGICCAADPVVTVVGKAGTGKTFTLDAARDALTASGIPVVGAALAARAAAELEAGSGIPSTTLARLLADIERPEGRLMAGSVVVVVDEAGMVGTRNLHRLLTLAGGQHAKVVLVGDPAQLPEIAAGGTFARLLATTQRLELTVNRRQTEAWEQAALDQIRERHPGPALARYGENGRITLADTSGELRDQMAADWHHAHTGGEQVVMLAVRRADVADLNQRAQRQLLASGHLDHSTGSLDLPGGQRVFVGDKIVCGRNDRRAGLINGTRLTITATDPDRGTITGTGPDRAPINVPGTYIAQGHVALGYASTVHKAQGRTVDRALLLGDDRLFAEAGYVGLSRGRHINQLYVVADTNPLHQGTTPRSGLAGYVCEALGVSKAQTVAADHVADRIPDAPLPLLIAEADRLTEQLLATMPRPATSRLHAGYHTDIAQQRIDGRDTWSVKHRRDGERLARLTAAVDRRAERLGLAALADPPQHLTRLLGPVPDTPYERRAWTETATSVEAWREISGRGPSRGTRRLLAEPGADRTEHAWWQRATRRLDTYQTRRRDPIALGENRTPTVDLDRSWQPDKNRGLNR
ncbi:MAG: relaxase domain-containing protein [Actinomycetota bacterium]|nr:relaxase domain-containing protein [Actinomycetota bacterium]